MIIVNILANALPLNNIDTGTISDNYANLFAPAGITFSIWGVIYLLVLFFIIYQTAFLNENNSGLNASEGKTLRAYFILSSIANATWLFAWHYDLMPVSLLIMCIIFFSLMKITNILNKAELSKKDKIFINLPFSIYFGWISIAIIANIIVLMVYLGWNSMNLSGVFITIFFLILGVIITGYFTIKNKDIAYGLVPVWAYSGIFIKHFAPPPYGFSGNYIPIIISVIISIIALLVIILFTLVKGQGNLKIKD